MDQKTLMQNVRDQLAIDLNCLSDDFLSDGMVFVEARENPGRRPFPRGESHFDMLTMGRAVIVSATADLLEFLKFQLRGKGAYDAFAMPFIRGQSLYYLPDLKRIERLPAPEGVRLVIAEGTAIHEYYALPGFKNAIQYNVNHPRPDALAVVALKGDQVVGIAGCSADCERLWQVGIDVKPEHRQGGLASAIVNRLTHEVLERERVPYYGTSTCNIASQRVAQRSGYQVAWACTFQGHFGVITTAPCG